MPELTPPRPESVTAPGHDPATRLEFWGWDRDLLGRSRAWGALDRLRSDPRVGVVALLVVALVLGLGWYWVGSRAPASSGDAGRAPARSAGVATTTTTSVALVVHVAGAVAHPGVVHLAAGSRVIDALEAAGGSLPGADLDRLNLAAKLVDGQRVAVATPGVPLADGGATGASEAPGVDGATPATPIDLNAATVAELDTLPGIGPTLAAAIVRERDRRGGFRSVDELRGVRGIGEKRFADLRDLVTV